MTFVMREHPAWTAVDGTWMRILGSPNRWSAVLTTAAGWQIDGPAPRAPDVIELPKLPSTVPASLARNVAEVGTVVRWRASDLWEAMATAIIRQVIRADQARRLHERFRAAHGTPLDTAYGTAYLMPEPAVVADLPAEAFTALGMAFKRRPLQTAAAAYLDHGDKWRELSPTRLVEELQLLPRIGPWTAGATVADYTHDWTLYPYGDLAVRKWAAAAAPDVRWPSDEEAFAAYWRRIAGDHLGSLTLFTLAWGVRHATSS